MIPQRAPRAGSTESEESEEEPGIAEQVARLQRQMDKQIERQVELRVREERARMAQEAVTPRRTGPPAPGTLASLPGKRIHAIVQRMWEDTEMSVSQAYKEYEEAVDEVEAAMDRNPREAPILLRAADEAKRAWEDAGKTAIRSRWT